MLLALCILAGASSVTAFADVATDEERAEAFIDAVNEIYEKTSILDRETAIAVAKSDAMYFDDESFDGVTEALAGLAEAERVLAEDIANCLAFCDLVDEASVLDDVEDYLELKAIFAEAKAYLDIIDVTYIGIPGAMSIYSKKLSSVSDKEQRVIAYLEQVSAMIAASNYSDKRAAYTMAKSIASGKDFLSTHPDVIASKTALSAAEDYFSECALMAAMLAEKVDGIYSADVQGEAINEAYEIYLEMDRTYSSVYIGEFELIVEEYNDAVAKINALFGG